MCVRGTEIYNHRFSIAKFMRLVQDKPNDTARKLSETAFRIIQRRYRRCVGFGHHEDRGPERKYLYSGKIRPRFYILSISRNDLTVPSRSGSSPLCELRRGRREAKNNLWRTGA